MKLALFSLSLSRAWLACFPQDFTAEEVPLEEVTPQMNQALYMLRRSCLPSLAHLSEEERKKVGERYVSELLVDFEVLVPVDPAGFKTQVLESLNMNR